MITIYNRGDHECVNVEFQDQHSSIRIHLHKNPNQPPRMRQIKIVGDVVGLVYGEDLIHGEDEKEVCDTLG